MKFKSLFIRSLIWQCLLLLSAEVLAQEARGILIPPGNQPPKPFNLISPSGDDPLDLDAVFLWEEAIDPEGQEVTYTLLVSAKEDFSSIAHRQLRLTEPFAIVSTENAPNLQKDILYSWKVIATAPPKNSSVAAKGASTFTESNVLTFETSGNINFRGVHVLVQSLQTRSVLANAQVTAEILGSQDPPIDFDPVGGYKVGFFAPGAILNITASDEDCSDHTETHTVIDMTPQYPPTNPTLLNCAMSDPIFIHHFED